MGMGARATADRGEGGGPERHGSPVPEGTSAVMVRLRMPSHAREKRARPARIL